MKSKLYCKFLASFLFLLLIVGCQSQPQNGHQDHTNHQSQSNNQNQSKKDNSKNNLKFLEDKVEVKQQGYGLFNVSSLHENNIKGNNVKIAVIDTGIDKNHKDLSIVASKNFVDSENESTMDGIGHGTKVSGIIAAKENNFGLQGIAPNSQPYIGKVANDMGYAKFEDLIKGIQWAIDQKVDIINISLEFYKENKKKIT